MTISEVFVNLLVEDGNITKVDSTGSIANDDILGKKPDDLLFPVPESESYILVSFSPSEDHSVTAAARMRPDGDGFLIYYLEGSVLYMDHSSTFLSLRPSHPLPIVSPGLVVLLGYTPWELCESDLLQLFTKAKLDTSLETVIIDRSGESHDLIFRPVSRSAGGMDVFILPKPRDNSTDLNNIIKYWSETPVEGIEKDLDFFLGKTGLTGACILRKTDREFRIWANKGIDITPEDLNEGGTLHGCLEQGTVWLNVDEESAVASGRGQILVYPFGLGGRYVLVAATEGNARSVENRLSAMIHFLSMRLDLWTGLVNNAEFQEKKALFTDTETRIIEKRIERYEDLEEILISVAESTGASLIAIIEEQKETSRIVVSAGSVSEHLKPDEIEYFIESISGKNSETARINNNFKLIMCSENGTETFRNVVGSLARIFDRLCSGSQFSEPPQILLDELPVVVIDNNFSVTWHGSIAGVSKCFEFFDRDEPCNDCPLITNNDSQIEPVCTLRRGSTFEIVVRSPERSMIFWNELPTPETPYRNKQDPKGELLDNIPSGVATYSCDGCILEWNRWFETATGVPLSSAIGQNAGRLVNRLGSSYLTRQFENALGGKFFAESLEFNLNGRSCLSSIQKSPGGNLIHFIVDTGKTAADLGNIFIGSGLLIPGSQQTSLASSLAAVCETERWEFDISSTTSDHGAPSWLSQKSFTDLLTITFNKIKAFCSDRWVSLDTTESNNDIDGFILPGVYHILEFHTLPMLLPVQKNFLIELTRTLRSLGGWLNLKQETESLKIGLPSALTCDQTTDRISMFNYPQDTSFQKTCSSVLPKLVKSVEMLTDIGALADIQPHSSLILIRITPAQYSLVPALVSRCPFQPLVVATAARPDIPLQATMIKHLQLPAEEEELLTALRKLLLYK